MTAISVLILTRHRDDDLARLIEGLERSTVAPLELVVVDMGDTPARLPFTALPLTIRALAGATLPLAAARNRAAEAASGDQLLFVDVDCIAGAELIGTVSSRLSALDVVLCSEALYLDDGAARTPDWTEADLRARGRSHPARRFPAQGLEAQANPGLFWSLAFALRAARYRALGGFDEAFVGYGAEATDFGFRIAASGTPLMFLGGPVVFHQNHDSFDPPLQHFGDIVRNAVLFRCKWNLWPMTGWLEAFERLGLCRRTEQDIVILRHPSPAEIISAHRTGDLPESDLA